MQSKSAHSELCSGLFVILALAMPMVGSINRSSKPNDRGYETKKVVQLSSEMSL